MANTNPLPQLPPCNLPIFTLPGLPDILAILISLIPGWPPPFPDPPIGLPKIPCPFSEVP